ncbi:hypothetical protein M8J77_005427 [Diaphorina citri]|nr:hypothetical protein M8J77_005427 [Diaphorina citri]
MNCREILSEIFGLKYFLSPLLSRGSASTQGISRYKLSPCGHLLAENIKKEWVRSCVLRREEPAFLYSQQGDCENETDLQDMFLTTKELSNGKVPFIVANIAREIASQTDSEIKTDLDWRPYFSPSQFTSLRASLFVTPSRGQQLFYHWQSQRKYWWRKFSCDPGKVSVVEDIPNRTVSIQIELPGESHQVIETIVNHGTAYFDRLQPQQRDAYEIKDGRKKTVPYLIESRLNLEVAALMFLCQGLTLSGDRKVLRLHRRLAPYKVAFLNSTDDELKSLAVYLYENLRQSHIYCLFTPLDSSSKSPGSIESQLSANDKLGVPYSILIRDTALQDGLISIRNRDTTLEEKVHISKVNDYIESLLKNY